MIKVVLIDDHQLVLKGVSLLINDSNFCRVVAVAQTGYEGIQKVREHKPDVVILDFHLPDISGLEVTSKLKRIDPNLKILILSAEGSEVFSSKLLSTGAIGYLTKQSSQEELLRAIKMIHKGSKVISPELIDKIISQHLNTASRSEFHQLTQRELEIALMIVRGCAIHQIAKKLYISEKTVHTYRYRIYQKLNITNDVQLTRLALRIDSGLAERATKHE